ncbi:MAG: hypothetical protein NTV23_10970 [Propionibacteriales bacterium]|nr:hypothetical protein [Propionibacteriales bacterium]
MKLSHRVRSVSVGAAALALALSLSACGSDTKDTGSVREAAGDATATPRAQVTAAPAADAAVIKITLDGTSVSPDGESRSVKRNQPVVFQITAASAGQLHVHSSPEQVIDFPAGDSEITVTFTIPGVVAVEDHDLDALIVQLEVN